MVPLLQAKNIKKEQYETNEASEQPFEGQSNGLASPKQEDQDLPTDFAYPFLQRASYMLGNISAPPAFASEFLSQYLAAASQASTSVRVTTGMIRIPNISFTGTKLDFSFGKNGHLDIVLSLKLNQNHRERVGSNSGKAGSGVSRNWFCCLFLWIMVLSLSFKISSFVCPICPRSYMS